MQNVVKKRELLPVKIRMDSAEKAEDSQGGSLARPLNPETANFKMAIESNNIDRVQKLILGGEDVNQRLTGERLCPLHVAVKHGCETICMMLLKQRALVNVQDLHGLTPLHYVALRSVNLDNKTYYQIFERILESLVNFGAKFDIKAKDGSLPIDLAKKSDDRELLAMFFRNQR